MQRSVDDENCHHLGDATSEAPCNLEVLKGIEGDLSNNQQEIESRLKAKCMKHYDVLLCESIVKTVFDGVDSGEVDDDTICQELRGLVGAHFCHLKSANKLGE